MKIIVNAHKCEIDKTPVNEKEINITKCEFEFADEITDSFVKEAYFTLGKGETYKQIIVDNACDIPGEVLEKKGDVTIGVVAYLVENENIIKRYNPSPAYFNTWEGSLRNAENSQPITPSEMEQYEQALQDGLSEVNQKLVDIDEAIIEVGEAIEGANNLDLDVSKEGKTATVTLIKKDASTKVVTLSDGTSLMFNWDGTKLGIKTDEDAEYTYVDLQGIQGEQGPMGAPFTIKKTYSSTAEMNADFNNMNVGDYVMITSTVEVEDNAKLYSRGEEQWIFITDFSGATGIQGPTGLTPNIQIGTVTSGETPSVTRTGTNENPVLNFTLVRGETGATGSQGIQGETGNGIASITKTSTEGLVDTYTITYTDGTTSTFQVTNGEDGEVTLTQFNALKTRVEDLENNQLFNEVEGTDINITDAHNTRVYDLELSKESSQETSILPSEYIQVDYIECDGNQYIDTNFIPNQDTRLTMSIDSLVSENNWLFGSRVGNVSENFSSFYQAGSGLRFNYGNNQSIFNIDINQKLNIDFNKNNLYINSQLLRTFNYMNFNTNYTLALFTLHYPNGFSTSGGKFKLYYSKIYDNDVLVRDFIPCYRNLDNEVGLYDLVNDVFYTNQGTGAFTYGSVAQLPNPDYPQEVKTVKGYENLVDLHWNTTSYTNKTYNDDGSLSVVNNTSSPLSGITIELTDRLEKGTYTIKNILGRGIYLQTTGGSDYSNLINKGSSKTFEYNGTSFLRILGVNIPANSTVTFKLLLTQGDQELPYVPYGNNYVDVAISDGTNTNNYPIPLNGNELVGIRNYKDELLVDKEGHCWLNKKIKKVVFDGSENWYGNGENTNYGQYYTSTTDKAYGYDLLSNYFIVSSSANGNYIRGGTDNSDIYITIAKSIVSYKLTSFKTWLSTHNTEVYYALATPQLIDLNTTVDIRLFKGVNNITNSEDGNMRIRYVESIESIINDFDTRLKALEQGESL